MKKLLPYLPPAAILAVLLALSLWNAAYIDGETGRWRDQLDRSNALAFADRWPEAKAALDESYDDWTRRQTYLHIVAEHDTVDDAEAMYRRAMAFADTREITEFRAELADLLDQLRLLSETERLSLKNVL